MTQFGQLLHQLIDGDVDFIVVGGVAATVHGSARLTQDLDIVYARNEGNIARLIAAVTPLEPYLRGAPPGLPFSWDRVTVHAGLNLTLVTKLGNLDLLGEIAGGGPYESLVGSSLMVSLDKTEFRCLGLQQLIDAKRAAGRPRDLETIAELEIIRDELT